jgi:outer membrane protein assembly factor BamB
VPRRSVSVLTFAVVFAFFPGILPSAQANAAEATIRLSPDVGPPTRPITVRGREFGASERVRLDLDGSFLAAAVTDPTGAFSRRIRIPAEAVPGPHLVGATGRSSGKHAAAEFLVRTDWRRFHFDSANTGHNPFENVLNTSNVASLEVKWTVDTSAGAAPTPVVWGGRVYAASADGVVRALDASTGSTIWSQDVGETDGSPPDVVNGVAYVMNTTAEVLALDAETGDIMWSPDIGLANISAPNVWNGNVYATANIDVPGGSANRTAALDAVTGAPLWREVTRGAPEALAVAEGLVYTAGAIGGYVSAYDALTGAERWSVFECGEYCPVSSVTVSGGVAFLRYDTKGLWALDALTGDSRWTGDADGFSYNAAPAVANGLVYLGSLDEELVAWDEVTGEVRWTAVLPEGTQDSSPAVANGVLYIGSEDRRLRAYDAATGDLLWESSDLGSPFKASPAVADGLVYGAVEDGTVYAFGLP